MDLYSVLWLEKSASKDDIKKAYRKLAMKYHPDRNKWDKESEAKFKEVNQAYSVLSDDAKRKQYDTFWTTWQSGWFWGGFQADVDISDIFESFFGWGFWWWNRGRRSSSQRWEDIEQTLEIDLKTSIYWGKEKISFFIMDSCKDCKWVWWKDKTTCSKCNGSWHVTYTKQSIFGVIQQSGVCDKCGWSWEEFREVCKTCDWAKRVKVKKDLDLDIPAWIDHGMIIKLEWEANAWIWTEVSWDLYIRFSVKLEEKGLKRRKSDLFYDLEIDLLEAVMGTEKEINIPVLWKRTIIIKSWTQPWDVLKLSWDGVVSINSDTKWDLYITLKVKVPKKLNKKEKELYLDLAKEKKLNVNNHKWIFEKIFG